MLNVSEWSIGLLAATALLAGLLLAAARYDLRSRRIPNELSVGLLAVGLLVSILRAPSMGTIGWSLAGVATGLAVWLPMYAMRLLGAGDVKLFAAGAAWLGWKGALFAAIVTSVTGGLLAIVWLLYRQGGRATAMAVTHALRAPRLLRLQPLDRGERLPYALAIACGLLAGWIALVLRMFPGGVS